MDSCMTEQEIRERIAEYTHFTHRGRLEIKSDTSEFMSIQAGDVLELDGRHYLIRGEEMEGRFGLDGEPKFWVKRAIDLADGLPKVIKLVFLESFNMRLGEQLIRCFRSPQKESRILDKVRNHPQFMQGFTIADSAGNPVRIIDKIQGKPYYEHINALEMDHASYFQESFPALFNNILQCVEAIDQLHKMDELHGDIRNDHIFIERHTQVFKWIDFDYTYEWSENPYGVDLFGLGNILLFTVGKGFHNVTDVANKYPNGAKIIERLTEDDLSLFFKHRIINLRKLFPYIDECLNHVLMHFAHGSDVFYENTAELLDDLRFCGF
jgi:hypothetical protein